MTNYAFSHPEIQILARSAYERLFHFLADHHLTNTQASVSAYKLVFRAIYLSNSVNFMHIWKLKNECAKQTSLKNNFMLKNLQLSQTKSRDSYCINDAIVEIIISSVEVISFQKHFYCTSLSRREWGNKDLVRGETKSLGENWAFFLYGFLSHFKYMLSHLIKNIWLLDNFDTHFRRKYGSGKCDLKESGRTWHR